MRLSPLTFHRNHVRHPAGKPLSRRTGRVLCEALENRCLLSAVLSDAFSGSNGASIAGRTADTTDLPGATWSVLPFNSAGGFGATLDTSSGDGTPSAKFNAAGNSTGGIAVSIDDAGSYSKPQVLTISADLSFDTASNDRLGLGFYSQLPSAGSGDTINSHFTGLRILNTNGEMTLLVNGSQVGSAISYSGTWSASAYHTLAYTVDTSTGAISDISLEGSSSTYSFSTSGFTDSATDYAAATVSSTFGRDHSGHVDNFSLSGDSGSGGEAVQDAFSGSNGAGISGRTPDTSDTPGGTWSVLPFNSNGGFGATVDTSSGDGTPSAKLNAGGNSTGGIAISIDDAGSYSKPQVLTISAGLSFDTASNDQVGLGFYSQLPSAGSGNTVNSYFSGLRVLNTNGDMTLLVNGSQVGSAVSYTGTWSASAYHTLTYTVDTSSGAISNISLEGSTSSYSFSTSGFTDSATAYAAAIVSSTFGRDHSAHVDNFDVSGGSGGGGGGDTGLANPFGVATSSNAYGDYANWMPQVAAAGVGWVRAFPEWGNIEPSDNNWSWSGVDNLISTADSNNLHVSGLLYYSALWVNSSTHTLPVNNLTAWADYVSHVVAHTAGEVDNFEIWNEPNSPAFATNSSPSNYASVVVSAYNAAHAANSNVKVGLQVADVDINFLKQAIQDGAADHYDYITVHPYSVLGTVPQGNDGEYMHIVQTIRTMLQANDPDHADVPIWFTEIGTTSSASESTQAQAALKTYVMGIAQGVTHIDWYEAKDGESSFGLIRSNGTVKPSYTALDNLSSQLGSSPDYKGWVLFNNSDYGFVFQNGSSNTMAVWAPPGASHSITFTSNVQVLDPLTGTTTTLTAGNPLSLTNDVKLVLNVPAALVTQAVANATQPFPWGGDYTNAASVSVTAGSPNVDAGLHQLNADGTSTAVQVGGVWARDASQAAIQSFTVDPNYLSYTPTSITITAVLRGTGGGGSGFNLKYESTSGWKSAGWYTVPGSGQWYTKTWTITDDEFDGNWGYNFKFDSDSTTYSHYYIQSVTITKNGMGSAASGTYQVENATTSSGTTAATNQSGYTGTGFIDFLNSSGDYFQMNNVFSATSGSRTLRIRYANGDGANRPLSLMVNGSVVNPSLAFNSTGGWSLWTTIEVTVGLQSGYNSIRLTDTGSSGPNIDSFEII